MNAEGNRVAIGAFSNDGDSGDINNDRGHVRVYEINNLNDCI